MNRCLLLLLASSASVACDNVHTVGGLGDAVPGADHAISGDAGASHDAAGPADARTGDAGSPMDSGGRDAGPSDGSSCLLAHDPIGPCDQGQCGPGALCIGGNCIGCFNGDCSGCDPQPCGATTCVTGQYCVNPCCGGAIPQCVPAPDAGGCPPGTEFGQCLGSSGPTTGCVVACTPPPPFCAPIPAGCDPSTACGCAEAPALCPSQNGACGTNRDVMCLCA